MSSTSTTPQRRRGAELETALLDAAWAELSDNGYDGFTIDAVAKRARTSRAVLYRRWPTKPALIEAVVRHMRQQQPVEIPDTGSVRGDVIELLRRADQARAPMAAVMALQLSGYYAETHSSPAELRTRFLAGRNDALDTVLARAVQRGEIDPARLTPRVAAVPFDLYRQEFMMTLKPVPLAVIESIVDEVFLPLVAS